MAKKSKDQFDIFREATLGTKSSLSSLNPVNTQREQTVATPLPTQTVTPAPQPAPAPVSTPAPAPAPVQVSPVEKISKNANRVLVSFHIGKDNKKRLNLLKVETEKSLDDLYNEAIEDLLAKYSR